MMDALKPMINEIARVTAKMVLEELRRDPIIKPRWTDTAGAATHLGWTKTSLAQRKSKGQVPETCFRKVANSLRWDIEALDEWMISGTA